MRTEFKIGDLVKVEYSYGKFYEGKILWTERYSNMDWVTVRPLEEKFISTFGSSRDMGNGYKSYIVNDPILCKVTLMNS